MMQRLADYKIWGFKYVWLVDPWNHKLFIFDSGGFNEVWSFELPEFGATISAAEIFI